MVNATHTTGSRSVRRAVVRIAFALPLRRLRRSWHRGIFSRTALVSDAVGIACTSATFAMLWHGRGLI